MAVCNECGGTVIEYDAAAGNGFCVQCGVVVEENMIVSEVSFGESSSGAAVAHGSFLGQGATHARMSGPYGNRGGGESREQTIANATARINKIAAVLRLSDVVCLAATRMYTLAVEHKFTKGRKSMNVVAVCLYIACRQKETRNYMLIDFSDLLQVNVFELGHIYLQLVQTLGLRLPLVDPSHYISRFAALLEFGDETHKVATDAVRLVQRFDRDWMTRGRRPAGICGAALLLAARMNNFRRSVEEIVQVVKIADTTLKKRLEEFKNTPSGSLTLADFRNVWLDEEMDPPAFMKGREKERKAAELAAAAENGEEEEGTATAGEKPKKGRKKRTGKRKRIETDDEEREDSIPVANQEQSLQQPMQTPLGLSLLGEGILADVDVIPSLTSTAVNVELPTPPDTQLFIPDSNIDPSLLSSNSRSNTLYPSTSIYISAPSDSNATSLSSTLAPLDEVDETTNDLLASEVSSFLSNTQGTLLSSALDEVEQRRIAHIEARRKQQEQQAILQKQRQLEVQQFTDNPDTGNEAEDVMEMDDLLLGLDEEELDFFILSEDEVKLKERIWVEMNRDYLEALAAKGDPNATGNTNPKSRKRQKTSNKPRDASTPHGSTAAESVRNMIKKNPKYSKKINYDALKDLFVDFQDPNVEDKDGDEHVLHRDEDGDMDVSGMYTMDGGDKSDAESVGSRAIVVIESNDGDVTVVAKEKDVHMEDEYDDGVEKEDTWGDDFGYEQEV